MKILELREHLGESISKVIGAPANQISLIITMLSVIPFCLLNYFIHGKQIRLIYSLILGFLFQFSIYKFNSIHIFVSAIFTYLFIVYFGRKVSAFYVLIFSFLYLSYLHIKRMFFEYGEWRVDDPTTIYMISIAKFTSLAFSYEDGGLNLEELKNSHHREYRIVERPTLLEVLSFIYFYPTSIIGPCIEFKDFINFINEKDCYAHLNENIFYILINGILYFIASFIAMAYYSIISNKIPLEVVAEKEFGQHSLLYSLLYIKICIPAIRARYYSGWNLSYSTLIFSGLSYTEKEIKGEKVKSLEKGSYGRVISSEWSINPNEAINEWNKTIHLWLKYNVYTRILKIKHKKFNGEKNKSLANFITFICSAIWHGFYLTYYLTFFFLYCYKTSGDMLDKLKVYEWIYKRPYLKPFAALFNFLVFDTLSIIFLNLEWDKALLGLKNIRFYPIIVILGLYIFTSFIKIPKEKREKPKEVEEKIKREKKVE
jgi:hypothetical protein